MVRAFRTSSLFSVTALRIMDMALQFLTPLLLVRLLSQNDFGDYRIFWLTVNTVMFIAPLGMPRSLFHFIPKAAKNSQVLPYIFNAAVVSVIVASFIIILVWLFSELLPGASGVFLFRYGEVVVFFTIIWSFSALWENLPNALEDHAKQATLSFLMTALRVAAVISIAAAGEGLGMLFSAIIIVGLVQAIMVSIYIGDRVGWDTSDISWWLFIKQFSYAAPYGLAASASSLRRNVDQWIVLARFANSQFATLSLASSLVMPFEVFRATIISLTLPYLSRAHGKSIKRALVLYRKIAPAHFAIFSFAAGIGFIVGPAISTFFFGDAYSQAGVIVAFYVMQVAIQTVGCSTIFSLVGKGFVALIISLLQILISAIGTFFGIERFGLVGAVCGPLLSTFIGEFLMLYFMARFARVDISSIHDWRKIGYIFGAGVFALFAAKLVGGISEFHGFLSFLAGFFVYFLICISFFVYSRRLGFNFKILF